MPALGPSPLLDASTTNQIPASTNWDGSGPCATARPMTGAARGAGGLAEFDLILHLMLVETNRVVSQTLVLEAILLSTSDLVALVSTFVVMF